MKSKDSLELIDIDIKAPYLGIKEDDSTIPSFVTSVNNNQLNGTDPHMPFIDRGIILKFSPHLPPAEAFPNPDHHWPKKLSQQHKY